MARAQSTPDTYSPVVSYQYFDLPSNVELTLLNSQSVSYSFNTVVAPVITTISPDPVTGSDSVQTITINGSGFVSGMTALVAWSTGSATLSDASKIVVASPTQARIFITTQTDPDKWTVQVTNPEGQSSNVFSFQVVAPPVTPPPVTPAPTTPPPTTPQPTAPPSTPSQSITSPATATGNPGFAFRYQITASNQPVSFATTSLPDGLTFDSSSGVISGVPKATGTFSVILAASGADNTLATGTLTLTFTQIGFLLPPTSAPPVLTFPPEPLNSGLSPFLAAYGSAFPSTTQAVLLDKQSLLDELINPGKGSFLKKAAAGTAQAITVGNAVLALADATSVDNTLDALKNAILPFADLAGGENAKVIDEINLIASLTLATAEDADVVPALLDLNSFIYGDLLSPQLVRYSQDPPSTDYQAVVPLDDVSQLPTLASTGNAALDAMFTASVSDSAQSAALLKAVNDSFDRYSGALAAGDANSAGLQLEAMLYYLGLYDAATQAASADLRKIVGQLPAAGITDATYAPAAVRALQQIAAAGLPADLVQTLTADGLSSDQIESARQAFVQFDADSVSGTRYGQLSALSALLSQVTSTPTSLVTVAAGVSKISASSHQKGSFVVTRMGNLSAALSVQYKVSGSAKSGVDYKALGGSVTIPAGVTKAKIKVKPLDGLTGAGTLKLKLALVAPTDGSYLVGTGTVKIKLIGDN